MKNTWQWAVLKDPAAQLQGRWALHKYTKTAQAQTAQSEELVTTMGKLEPLASGAKGAHMVPQHQQEW